MRKLFSVFAVMAAFSLAPNAQALVKVGALGGVNLGDYSVSSDNNLNFSVNSDMGYLGGAFVGLPLAPFLGLELGGYYNERTLVRDRENSDVKDDLTSIHVPFLVRVTALPVVSVGAGVSYDIGQGKVSRRTVTDEVSISSEFDYSELNLEKNQWSLVGSVRAEFSIAPLVGFALEGRYVRGLTDRSTNDQLEVKLNDYQVLAGLTFGL